MPLGLKLHAPWTLSWTAASTPTFLLPDGVTTTTLPTAANALSINPQPDGDLVLLNIAVELLSGTLGAWVGVNLKAAGAFGYGDDTGQRRLAFLDTLANTGEGALAIYAAPNIAAAIGQADLAVSGANAYVPPSGSAVGTIRGGPLWIAAAPLAALVQGGPLGLMGCSRIAWTLRFEPAATTTASIKVTIIEKLLMVA